MNELLDLPMTAMALATVRISVGVLFFAQAYDKMVTVGLKEFTANVTAGTERKKLPTPFVRSSIFLSSSIELVGGVLLILGLFLPVVYALLALNLVMVCIGFSYLQPIWDLKHWFPRLAMLIFLMMTPLELDLFCLDRLI